MLILALLLVALFIIMLNAPRDASGAHKIFINDLLERYVQNASMLWQCSCASVVKRCACSRSSMIMYMQEAVVFLDVLRNHCRPELNNGCRYLEFGSGGSTELISWLLINGATSSMNISVADAVSIESSSDFLADMRRGSRHVVSAATSRRRLRLLHGDVGPTGRLGYPSTPCARTVQNGTGCIDRARRYVQAASQLANARGSFDVVLIDGRWRVACALEAIAAPLLSPRGVVLVHDFSTRDSKGKEYRKGILKYFHLVRQVRSLAVLRPRRGLLLTSANATRHAVVNKRAMMRAERKEPGMEEPPAAIGGGSAPTPASRPVYAAASSLREELLRDQLRALESPH